MRSRLAAWWGRERSWSQCPDAWETEWMFGRRKKERELEPPPVARENSEAVEVLRVWAQPDSHHQVSLKTTWREPGAWGLLLVDLARHAARAYEREGMDASEALAQIRQLFDAEWTSPTDEPEDLTDNR